jgi:hypothetical protein
MFSPLTYITADSLQMIKASAELAKFIPTITSVTFLVPSQIEVGSYWQSAQNQTKTLLRQLSAEWIMAAKAQVRPLVKDERLQYQLVEAILTGAQVIVTETSLVPETLKGLIKEIKAEDLRARYAKDCIGTID